MTGFQDAERVKAEIDAHGLVNFDIAVYAYKIDDETGELAEHTEVPWKKHISISKADLLRLIVRNGMSEDPSHQQDGPMNLWDD